MPASIPSGAKPGAPPLVPGNPFAYPVTYPSSVGTLVLTVNLLPFMSVGTQSLQMPAPNRGAYSDAWLEIINFSDSLLSPIFDTGTGPEPPIPPGYAWAVPIPLSATKLTATVLLQTSTQQFPNELAFVTFYTASDLASGHIPRNGPLVPSVPAASIGCGTLPACVIVPIAQEVDATHAANTVNGQVIANALTGISLWDDVANNRLWILPTEQDGKARGIGIGSVDAIGTAHLLGPFVDTSGNVRLENGTASTPTYYLIDQVNNTYARTDVNVEQYRILGSYRGGADSLLVETRIQDAAMTFAGGILSLSGQATAGSFGVPVIVAQALAVSVTVTTLQTILSFTPAATGIYRIIMYAYLGNAAPNASMGASWTDPNFGVVGAVGAGAEPILNAVSPHTLFAAYTPGAAGVVVPIPLIARASTSGAITVKYQNTGAAPNDVVNAIIERLA